MRLPKEFKKYFWDVDFNKLSYKKYPKFVLSRIMQYGDLFALKWLMKMPKRTILGVARTSREIDDKTKNYWETVYGR
ncbi:hypothetical protein HZC34_07680 [Candidatus Saganbacteria bacterium]|nr:hypothetical protein [Candidatus Saganbacteria bacterium]